VHEAKFPVLVYTAIDLRPTKNHGTAGIDLLIFMSNGSRVPSSLSFSHNIVWLSEFLARYVIIFRFQASRTLRSKVIEQTMSPKAQMRDCYTVLAVMRNADPRTIKTPAGVLLFCPSVPSVDFASLLRYSIHLFRFFTLLLSFHLPI
jgi:hypothetical protein